MASDNEDLHLIHLSISYYASIVVSSVNKILLLEAVVASTSFRIRHNEYI